jgi:hypothetical protein
VGVRRERGPQWLDKRFLMPAWWACTARLYLASAAAFTASRETLRLHCLVPGLIAVAVACSPDWVADTLRIGALAVGWWWPWPWWTDADADAAAEDEAGLSSAEEEARVSAAEDVAATLVAAPAEEEAGEPVAAGELVLAWADEVATAEDETV